MTVRGFMMTLCAERPAGGPLSLNRLTSGNGGRSADATFSALAEAESSARPCPGPVQAERGAARQPWLKPMSRPDPPNLTAASSGAAVHRRPGSVRRVEAVPTGDSRCPLAARRWRSPRWSGCGLYGLARPPPIGGVIPRNRLEGVEIGCDRCVRGVWRPVTGWRPGGGQSSEKVSVGPWRRRRWCSPSGGSNARRGHRLGHRDSRSAPFKPRHVVTTSQRGGRSPPCGAPDRRTVKPTVVLGPGLGTTPQSMPPASSRHRPGCHLQVQGRPSALGGDLVACSSGGLMAPRAVEADFTACITGTGQHQRRSGLHHQHRTVLSEVIYAVDLAKRAGTGPCR